MDEWVGVSPGSDGGREGQSPREQDRGHAITNVVVGAVVVVVVVVVVVAAVVAAFSLLSFSFS